MCQNSTNTAVIDRDSSAAKKNLEFLKHCISHTTSSDAARIRRGAYDDGSSVSFGREAASRSGKPDF